jgi:uncharacterized membrane protein YuzA (DUF378 family)
VYKIILNMYLGSIIYSVMFRLEKISRFIVFTSAINTGLIGFGYFYDVNLNILNHILHSYPVLEATAYITIGLAAIFQIMLGRK